MSCLVNLHSCSISLVTVLFNSAWLLIYKLFFTQNTVFLSQDSESIFLTIKKIFITLFMVYACICKSENRRKFFPTTNWVPGWNSGGQLGSKSLYPQSISLVLFDCCEFYNLIQLAIQSPADVFVQCCGQKICSTTVRSVSKLRQEFSEFEASLGCMVKVCLKTDLRGSRNKPAENKLNASSLVQKLKKQGVKNYGKSW